MALSYSARARRRMLAVGGAAAALLAVLVLSASPAVRAVAGVILAVVVAALLFTSASRGTAETPSGASLGRETPAGGVGTMLLRNDPPDRSEPSSLRRRAGREREAREGRAALGIAHRYLDDTRESLGAEEIVLYRALLQRGMHAVAGSPRAERPGAAQASLVPTLEWVAQERLPVAVERDGALFIATPVVCGEQMYGVLGARLPAAAGGDPGPRSPVRARVSRHGQHLGVLLELLESRRSARRAMARSHALMRAAERIQDNLDPAALARAVCATALEVTSASRAAAVEWDAARSTGVVVATSAAHPVAVGTRLGRDALVAIACRERQRLVFEDARTLAAGAQVFGEDERGAMSGSVGIVPLVREHGALGAIVVEGTEPGQIDSSEVETLALLATVAALSLEISRQFAQVSERAFRDPLTGLANRRVFDERLAHLLAESDRYGQPAALVLADLDHFKRINDSYGHEAGDAVLRHVAHVAMRTVRSIDLCARYGGEELALLLPHTDLARALEVAERLRQAVAAHPVRVGSDSIAVTASFGVASYPVSVPTRDALFQAADRALYRAKDLGRNRVELAQPKVVGC